MNRSIARKAAAALLALSLLPRAALVRAENLKITIYHTNDIHGWIMSRPASFYTRNPKRLVGGAAALASAVKKEKGPKILLDAGDWFQGTPEGNETKGESLVEVFNAVGYDAIEVGNHDFDFGEANLKKLVGRIKAPVLGANVYREKDGKRVDYLKPWVIKEVAGVKVGIFGLLTTKMRNLSFPENIAGLRFRRETDEARDDVKALRAQGATVIIALTHMGFEDPNLGKFEGDQTLASGVEGIDLIVGGHTHTAINDPPHDPKHGTLIVQAGTTLSRVGRVILEIDPKTKKVVSSSGTLVSLWIDETGEDAEVQKALKPYEEEVARAFDVVIATAAAALSHNCYSGGESVLGDWATDCARAYARTDIAIQNSCGLRAEMPAGPVTLRSIYDIMPFENYVTNLTMSGALVREALDYGAGRGHGIVQVSGVSFGYDRDAASGQRVSRVLVGGKPLDPAASYTVTTLDFLVRGGEGYSPLGRADKTEFTKVLQRDVLRRCAEKNPWITPPPGGRMHPLEDSLGTQERAR